MRIVLPMAGIGAAAPRIAAMLGIAALAPATGSDPASGCCNDADELAALEAGLAASPAGQGFMIYGFPQTLPQAQALDIMLASRAQPVHAAVMRVSDDNALADQLRQHLRCIACAWQTGADKSSPAARCPICGAPLQVVENEQKIALRVADIRRRTEQLRGYYRTQNKLIEIMPGDDEQHVVQRIRQITAQRYDNASRMEKQVESK